MTQKPRIIAPVFREKWGQHYSSRLWNNDRAAINAGYPVFAQPTAFFGTWEKVIDYGTVVNASLIRLSFVRRDVFGSLVLKVKLAYSTDSISWTEQTDVMQIYGVNFRYVRVRFEFGNLPSGTPMGLLLAITVEAGGVSSDKDILSLEDIRVRLDVKEIDDGGMMTANASDPSGTHVNFNKVFVDVRDLVLSPMGRDAFNLPFQYAVIFVDAPNPTGFEVFVWDSAGVRASPTCSWRAKGV